MKCNTCGSENVDGARFCASCGGLVATAEAGAKTLVGQLVGGRYHVKRVLGEGGMGVVYEAEQQMGSTVRKVALKTLHAHLSHDPSVSQRFHRECGTIAQLEHPNTIKVYDFGTTGDGTLYIAMEFVAGKSLNQQIQDGGALPPDRVNKIMRQIAGSLEEAHQQGVIHRDLKPDNVVLTERAGEKDVVKLLDFGIAARTESADAQREQKLTQQGMVLGTPPYMSPEQFTGKALDARSDVYSLGVMAYEMLTGRLPFDASTPWQWATEHMTSQPLPFEATSVSTAIPGQMRAAILRSLAKNRDDRQSSAKQFYEELAGEAPIPQAAVSSSGTAAMPTPPAFGAGVNAAARTAAMPAPAVSAPVAAHVPPATAPSRGGGGGKGLIVGLASVGGLLLIGIVIVAARSMKPAPEETLTSPFTSASTQAKIAPQIEPTEPAPQEAPAAPASAEPAEPGTTAAAAPGHTTAKPATGSGGAPAAQPTSASGGAAAAQPTTTPKPSAGGAPGQAAGGGGCAGCLSSASSGNFSAAASAYNACSDPAAKARCSAIVKGSAPRAAQAAAFNGNCAQAKSIAAAAQSMGAGANAFKAALGACK